MSDNSINSSKIDPVVVAGGDQDGVGGSGSGESVPLARRRARFDKRGNLLVKRATYFVPAIYEEYRRIAFFRHQNTYDLINEALEAYLPELKNGYRERLKEAGQEELPIP